MAAIEVGYVRADTAFVERLRSDLTRHSLDVTLREWSGEGTNAAESAEPDVDFTCLVWSRAAVAHDRAPAEIDRALARESGDPGAAVLPLVIASVPLPETLAHRRCAVFTEAYESGLAELLPTFGRIAVLTVCDEPKLDVKVRSARRGIAQRFGSFTLEDGITPVSAIDTHRIRMVAAFTVRGAGIVAMIESVGDPAQTPEFTELVGEKVLFSFEHNEIKPTNESVSQWFSEVNAAAREMSAQRQLRRSRRLSCKLSLALRGHESIFWAAAGPVGALVRWQRDDDTMFGVLQPKGTWDLEAVEDDNEALYMRAPIGYATDIAIEVQQVPFRTAGDYFALSSFALPNLQEESWPLVRRLIRYEDPAQIVRALAASHEPLFEDCGASLVYRVRSRPSRLTDEPADDSIKSWRNRTACNE